MPKVEKKKEKMSLQIKDIVKILELCSGSITELKYGDLSIRLNPYLTRNPYQLDNGQQREENTPLQAEPQVSPSLNQELNTSTQSQEQLDDELDLELVGMENPSEYFSQLEKEERERAKTNG